MGKKKITKTLIKHRSDHRVDPHLTHVHLGMSSIHLQRKVNVDVFIPEVQQTPLPILFLNDGQDAKLLKLEKTLISRFSLPSNKRFIVVGIHAGDRLQEYGTSGIPDYAGRGRKAGQHHAFVLEELLPFIGREFNAISTHGMTYAGFSLGGLSAMDAAWLHPDLFERVGVFSGSFWWRKKPYDNQYDDTYRIMHNRVSSGPFKPGLSFWFQAGTNDETADRNNNGIIDAIDDTLDLIKELESLGYSPDDIHYREVEDGEHNFHTWSEVFPEFLSWAFD